MRLTGLRIQNFRSCKDVTLWVSSIHALVGANNAGKSTILKALEFLFNPSIKQINEESFWGKDNSLEIRVEGIFSDLTLKEKEILKECIREDGSFYMARTAKLAGKKEVEDGSAEGDEEKIQISQQYKKPSPAIDWLCDGSINSKSISEWWKSKTSLSVDGKQFLDGVPKKPTVEQWKEAAREFIKDNIDNIPIEDQWIDNPRGYPNVLKNTLPFFVLVPAVRDASDESKGTKTSPFGQLLYAIIDSVSEEQREAINASIKEISKQMNRIGGESRVPLIAETEKGLNKILSDFFKGCDLEIEFTTPTLEVLLTTPKLFIDDGLRNSIENKGHGLQRAVIFSILRRYAEHMTRGDQGKKRNLVLAIEEPELYMHPQAQRTIWKVLHEIAKGGDQVIYSTHSSLLVEVGAFDEIIRVESHIQQGEKTNAPESNAWQLSMKSMIDDIVARHPALDGKVTVESMIEQYSHVYNPHRNEGFFASKIVLVEGLTEEYSLPIYAEALGSYSFESNNVGVVECGGKGVMDRFYRIFNELHIPCFILFDYDHGNSDTNILAKSAELLNLVGEKDSNPTKLFIGERIACFYSKWETDLRPEIPKFDQLTAEARKKIGLSDDGGKPLVARYIARKLTSGDSPEIPPTIKSIIEKAIQVEWYESCLSTKKSNPSLSSSPEQYVAAGAEAISESISIKTPAVTQ